MPRLYVIAGHGAGDPGACGNGYTEAERVRALAAAIKRRGGDSVVLLDTSRNWYADKGINQLSVPKGDCLVELHMDSATPSARGGHVIIKAGIGGPDQWDRALSERVSAIFPGRAKTIVESSDLANPNRAYKRGINYRLVENGFITNSGDVSTFNSRLGELADAYLAAFGVNELLGVSGGSSQSPDIDQMARDVIAGKYGNGDARKKALGSNYDAVQRRVNELLGVSGGSSSTSSTSSSKTWKVGASVQFTSPYDEHGTHLAVSGTYTIMQINGSRIVVGRGGVVTAAVPKGNLRLV